MSLENEKAQMLHEVHVQKEHMASEHERELEQIRETHKNEMKALEFRYKERQEKDAKVCECGYVCVCMLGGWVGG